MNIEVAPIVVVLVICVGIAVFGSVLTGNSIKDWYAHLVKPRWQIPLWAFVSVGVIGYILDAIILYRLLTVLTDSNGRIVALTAMLVVMLYNELWNYGFLGRRSTFIGFIGLLGFLAPLIIVLVTLAVYEPLSAVLWLVYVVWVIAYDVPWSYTLWKMNPDASK